MSRVGCLSGKALAYRARWVFPVDQPPIERGVVTVAGGRIAAVGKHVFGEPVLDLGDVALLPGLVNAHTHLEFSDLQQPLGKPGTAFAEWIRDVVKWRRSQQPEVGGRRSEIRSGLEESRKSGVVALGEIASSDWPQEAAQQTEGLNVTVFRELLGLARERLGSLMQIARAHVSRGQQSPIRPGLSPHAPYTVSPELLRQVCQLSATMRVPLAMHLAESLEELELLQSHSGPLVELLQSLGAWHPEELPIRLRPLDYLQLLATADRALVIHGNYFTDDEIKFLTSHRDRLSLVYCPRTHAYFGHEPYPLAKMLAAGIRVAVGTDSRASNPDLCLFAELCHIAQHHPAVPPAEILRLGTLAGAEALGVDADFGSITPGKAAQLAVVSLTEGTRAPLEAILNSPSSAQQCQSTLIIDGAENGIQD